MDDYLAQFEDMGSLPDDIDMEAMQQMYGDVGGYYDEDGNFIPVFPPEPQEEIERMPLSQLVSTCVLPSIESTAGNVTTLLVLCLLCTMLTELGRLQPILSHALHASTGAIACHLFFGKSGLLLFAYSLLSFAVLRCSWFQFRRGPSLSICTVTCVISCELFIAPHTWHAIRGAQMVLSMKAISLAFDMDRESSLGPAIWQYLGYAFSPASVIFGPWVPFSLYVECTECRKKTFGRQWLWYIVTRVGLSLTCLITSTCLTQWVFSDSRRTWLITYSDAQSFRFSHYFVGYLSELTSLLAGLGIYAEGSDGAAFVESVVVTRPSHIELPRSLVDVVTSWNLPMHRWLKTYVFTAARNTFGSAAALFLTYLASALLHGVNFQLAAVLLSLGLYSYVEHMLRRVLAAGFSACIEARSCKSSKSSQCPVQHRHGSLHPAVVVANLAFALLAMFHLAYLGVMFDTNEDQVKGYNMSHTLHKWSALGFASHYVAFTTYIFYWLVK